MFALYFAILNRNAGIEKVHTVVVVGRNRASDSWDYTKEKIKSLLSVFGLEGFFIALDALASRSTFFHHVCKVLGTLAIPIIVLVGVFFALAKIAANPFQRFTKWLTRELDIQLPGEEVE